MIELLAFAHVHVTAAVVRSTSLPTLRVLLSATSLVSSDRAVLASDPEKPKEIDRVWLTGPPGSPAASDVVCTATAGPWRFTLDGRTFDVDEDRPVLIPSGSWDRAMMEIVEGGLKTWLRVPTLRPFAYLWHEREALATDLCRVDFDRGRGRLRCTWRGERPWGEAGYGGPVVVIEDPSLETPSFREAHRRTAALRSELVVFRSTVEEIGGESLSKHFEAAPLEETQSFDAVPPSSALPFQPVEALSARVQPSAPALGRPLSVGELLVQARRTAATAPPAEAAQPLAATPLPGAAATDAPNGLVMLWWSTDAPRRIRRQPGLAAWLPRRRRVDTGAEDGETERTRRELTRALERATPTPLDALELGAGSEGDDELESDRLHVVAGWLEPEFDETAQLSATVAAVFPLRRTHPTVAEAATEAERILAEANLEEAPFVAADAHARLLEAVRGAVREAAPAIEGQAALALIRARKYARRVLEGTTLVRMRLVAGPEAQRVAYLQEQAAERLPLLRSTPVVLVASLSPPLEEADEAYALRVEIVARDLRRGVMGPR
jgi:hypothetical protein